MVNILTLLLDENNKQIETISINSCIYHNVLVGSKYCFEPAIVVEFEINCLELRF